MNEASLLSSLGTLGVKLDCFFLINVHVLDRILLLCNGRFLVSSYIKIQYY